MTKIEPPDICEELSEILNLLPEEGRAVFRHDLPAFSRVSADDDIEAASQRAKK